MRLFVAVAIVAGCAGILPTRASSQSLAEVAKKEKERRKTVTGESETIDDQALREASGEGLSITGSQADTEFDPEKEEPEASERAPARSPNPPAGTPGGSSGSSTNKTDPGALRERRRAHAAAIEESEKSVEKAKRQLEICKTESRRPGALGMDWKDMRDLGGCSYAEKQLKDAERYLRRLRASSP